jgi:S1-C subfamily serine protease
MRRKIWIVWLLCLAMVVFAVWYANSRRQHVPGIGSSVATVESAELNPAVILATGRTDSVLSSQPANSRPREEIVGVGLMLRTDSASREVMSAGLVPNSPAAEAGLVGRILIRKIDEVPTSGLTMRECVERLRGIAGSKVRLEVFDADANETRTVELTRRKLQIRATSPERER